ncbi:Group 3 truncated hemoglobin ctb [compost metagenome]|jgi:hemoglobin
MAETDCSPYVAGMTASDRPVAFRIDRPAPDRAEAAARREAAVARIRAETGIDEILIDALVEGFYARVREDDVIGPIFAARIADWAPHLEQMKLFWSSVALSTGVYQGRPMPKHLPLPIDARHFDRWLEIFEATARDLCPPVAADHFIVRARRIAESLELGVANAHGVLVGPGERYRRPDPSWTPES